MPRKKKKPTGAAAVVNPFPKYKPKVDLTDEQRNALDALKKMPKKIQSLGGYAGTGKTTLVSVLVDELKGFACCAYTGKAADVLRTKGINATTIHSLMYDIEVDEDGKPMLDNGKMVFTKKDTLECKGIIVDEASMVGAKIYADLISYDVPIIFVGDHGQLEPVGEDVYLMKHPDIRLETVHRNAGEIAQFACHIRNGMAPDTFGFSTGEVELIAKAEFAKTVDMSWQVICAYNRQRVGFNSYLRSKMGFAPNPIVGDRVISLRNSRRFNIFNGSQAIIKGVHQGVFGGTLRIERNKKTITVPFTPNTFNQEKPDLTCQEHPFDYAYAITCHKAQGSEWEKVAVLEEKCDLWDYNRWAYTAASRAKKKLLWVRN